MQNAEPRRQNTSPPVRLVQIPSAILLVSKYAWRGGPTTHHPLFFKHSENVTGNEGKEKAPNAQRLDERELLHAPGADSRVRYLTLL